jgi:hypothetical protein
MLLLLQGLSNESSSSQPRYTRHVKGTITWAWRTVALLDIMKDAIVATIYKYSWKQYSCYSGAQRLQRSVSDVSTNNRCKLLLYYCCWCIAWAYLDIPWHSCIITAIWEVGDLHKLLLLQGLSNESSSCQNMRANECLHKLSKSNSEAVGCTEKCNSCNYIYS